MKKHKTKQPHEYELAKISRKLVMRRAWSQAAKAAQKFGGRKSEYLSECLKIVWREHKAEISETNNEILAARIAYAEKIRNKKEHRENLEYAASVNKNAPRRELIPAGKHDVGKKLYGFIITGLGREFRPHTDMFSLGITPDTELVQYAYFN